MNSSYRGGPQHPMPSWFARALAQIPKALRKWNSLTPSRRKEVLRYFSRLKSQAARKRNLERILPALSGQPCRMMGRVWVDGS